MPSSISNSEQSRFPWHWIAAACLLVMLDYAIGMALQRAIWSTRSGESGGAVVAALTENPEVLLTGSSRAKMNFDSAIIKSALGGTSVLNAGQPNSGVRYSIALLKLIGESGAEYPRLVCLDVIATPRENNSWIRVLRPFAIQSRSLGEYLYNQDHSWQFRLAMASRMYRYNGLALGIISHLFDSRTINSTASLQTVTPATRRAVQRQESVANTTNFPPTPELSTDVKNDLQLFEREARLHRAQCVFVISPMLKRLRYYNSQNDKLAAFAASLNVPVIRYDQADQHPWVLDPQYYMDETHLNRQGAELLSADLGKQLAALRSNRKAQQ